MTVETILRNFFFIHSGNNALISALKSGGYAKTIPKMFPNLFHLKAYIHYFSYQVLG